MHRKAVYFRPPSTDSGGNIVKYTSMNRSSQAELLGTLGTMPEYLDARFSALSAEAALRPGPDAGFSPVEQCWHLADLEREGFGARMRRLRAEDKPRLPDFDGAAIARDRNYRTKSLAEGLAAFRRAREENLAFIASVGTSEWNRAGVQDGVGPVSLCDIPAMMTEHDAAHRAEIEAWLHQ
jgi:hypothetical protein